MLEVSPRVPVYPDVLFEANNLYTKVTVFREKFKSAEFQHQDSMVT